MCFDLVYTTASNSCPKLQPAVFAYHLPSQRLERKEDFGIFLVKKCGCESTPSKLQNSKNSQNQSKQQKESRLSRNQYELRVSGLDLAESCPRLWRDADYRVEGWKETEFLVFSSFFWFFDFARDEKERREKKYQREGKPHKQ